MIHDLALVAASPARHGLAVDDRPALVRLGRERRFEADFGFGEPGPGGSPRSSSN